MLDVRLSGVDVGAAGDDHQVGAALVRDKLGSVLRIVALFQDRSGWVVGGVQVLDGRTRLGRRLTFVVRSDDFPFEDVEHDCTRFMKALMEAVQEVLKGVMATHVQETEGRP